MFLSWWQGLVNRGKLQAKLSSARRLRRRRIESRRNLFEPLEPRVLLSGTDPYISLGPAAATGAYNGYTGDYVEIPIRIDQTGPSTDGNKFQGLNSAEVQVSFPASFFYTATSISGASSAPPSTGSTTPAVIWGPLANVNTWTTHSAAAGINGAYGIITVTASNSAQGSGSPNYTGNNDYSGTDPTNGGNAPNGDVLAFLFLCVKATTGSATVSVSSSPTTLTPDLASSDDALFTYNPTLTTYGKAKVTFATTPPSTTMSIVTGTSTSPPVTTINPVNTTQSYSVPVDLVPIEAGGPGIYSANALIAFDESYINPSSITVSEGTLLTLQGVSSADSGIDTTPSVNPLPNPSPYPYGTSQNLGYFTLSLDINTAAKDGASCTYIPNNVSGSLWIINFTTESSASVQGGATDLTTTLNLIPSLPGTNTTVKDGDLVPYAIGDGTTITNSPSDSVDGQITFNSTAPSASTSTTISSSEPTATYGAPPIFTATVTNTSGSGERPRGAWSSSTRASPATPSIRKPPPPAPPRRPRPGPSRRPPRN